VTDPLNIKSVQPETIIPDLGGYAIGQTVHFYPGHSDRYPNLWPHKFSIQSENDYWRDL